MEDHSTIDAAEAWQRPLAQPTAKLGPFERLAAVLRAWRQRQRQRREMSRMSARDFGDLTIPPSLLAEEMRRWPWQKPSPQWSEVAGGRQRQSADRA